MMHDLHHSSITQHDHADKTDTALLCTAIEKLQHFGPVTYIVSTRKLMGKIRFLHFSTVPKMEPTVKHLKA